MTVSSSTNKDIYSGTGSLKVFSYTFRILAEGDILVQLEDTNGVITTKTLTTDYTVSGVGDQSGGSITFVTAPAATDTVILTRNIGITQATDFTENSALPAETLEEGLDRLTMIDQDQQEQLDRSVKFDAGVSGFDPTLPDPTADQFVKINAAGTGFSLTTEVNADLTINGGTSNGLVTYNTTDTIDVESNATFDGSTLAITGAVSASGDISGNNISSSGNISVTGTVDGRDVATDGTKLDGIEASADVTDEANVTDALDGATLASVSPQGSDKVLIQDVTDSDVLKTVTVQSIADLGSVNQEDVEDIVGAMVTSNTETGISVTYQDIDGTLDFAVSDTTVAGDSGSTGITPGDTLTVAGGTGITTSMSGDTLTITNDISQLTEEEVEDFVGGMVTGNTETGISVTYQDVDGTLDFSVSDTTVAGDSGSTGITPGDTLTIAGGTNATTAMSGDTLTVNVDDAFLSNAGDVGTGVYDFGGATSFEIPNGAAPTVNAAGEIAVDTTITDYTGLIKYHDGTEELTVVAMPTANLTTTNDHVIVYDAAANEFKMEAQSGAGGSSGGAWEYVSTTTFSSSSGLIYTSLDANSKYKVEFNSVVNSNDTVEVHMQASTNNGSSYASADYQWARYTNASAASNSDNQNAGSIELTDGESIGNQTGEFAWSGTLYMHQVNTSGQPIQVNGMFLYQQTSGDLVMQYASGISADDGNAGSTLEIDAVQIYPTAGTFTSGTAILYKWVTS